MIRFLRQLKRLDKSLFIKLDRHKRRFVVYRRDRVNFPRGILVIENESGDFCYPNYHHIAKLYTMDSWANKHLITDIDKHNDSLDDEGDEYIHYLSGEISKLATRSQYF